MKHHLGTATEWANIEAMSATAKLSKADKAKRRKDLELSWTPIKDAMSNKDDRGDGGPRILGWIVRVLITLAATLASLHFWLQTAFFKKRYLVTDIYFVLWAVFGLGALLCAAGIGPCFEVWSWLGVTPWFNTITWLEVILVWRLVEALARELWIILYRKQPLASPARVIVTVLIDYATVIAIFGYLYEMGLAGYAQAASVGFTMSSAIPLEDSLLAVIQTAYCFLFLVIIVATFIGRTKFSPTKDQDAVDKAVSVLEGAADQIKELKTKAAAIPELEEKLKKAEESVASLKEERTEASEKGDPVQ